MRDGSRLDPVERLIDAWLAWEAASGSRSVCVERLDAIAALGLSHMDVDRAVAAVRGAGYDVPSAVQRTVLDQQMHLPRSTNKEAS